jgi:uncharacterized protein DUF4412
MGMAGIIDSQEALMRSGQTLTALGAAMVLNAAAAGAADGILIAQKMTSATGAVTTSQIQIEKTRMRAETAGASGRRQAMVFDGTEQVMRTIDDQAKTYTEMTKADLDRMSAQMSGAMGQMQEQMKNLPPEARARMEEMMKGRGISPAGSEPIVYKKIGTDKVGKWTCDKYEGTRGSEKVSEICTVSPATLGFTAADFEVTRQMAEFFAKLVPQGADQLFRIGTATANGFSGLPVRTVSFTNGAPGATTEITDAGRQNFPDSTFAVPAGYTKREMMGGRRGRP